MKVASTLPAYKTVRLSRVFLNAYNCLNLLQCGIGIQENIQGIRYGITKRFIVHAGDGVTGYINSIGKSYCQAGMFGFKIRKMLCAVAGIV